MWRKGNEIGKIICKKCSKYRPLETYNNILFNPLSIRKEELTEFYMRRKHEEKVFQSLLQRNSENEKECKLYAIDMKWFNKWKTFVTNDLEEKFMPNNEKYISDNKLIGVLPPGEIDNSKICVKDKNNVDKYKLKPGLTIKKDYCVINQFLWEWFKLNYDGGPEIVVGISNQKNNNSNLISKKSSDLKSESIIVNDETVFYMNSKDNFFKDSKSSESQMKSLEGSIIRDSINKINTVDGYKFKSKFNDISVLNEKTIESFQNQRKKESNSFDVDYIDTFGNKNNKNK